VEARVSTTSVIASGATPSTRSASIGQRVSTRSRLAADCALKPVSTRMRRSPQRSSQTKKSSGIGPSWGS
jgi:hypothetical protein